MKNLSQTVMILVRIVAVAAMLGGTPKIMYSVDMVISGNPTSKGTPSGTAFTAATTEHVTIITLQWIDGSPIDQNTK